MRVIRAILGVSILLSLHGCANRGSDIADQMNQIMIERIDSGDVKTEEQLENAKEGVLQESMKQLGIDPDRAVTTEEHDLFLAGFDNYKKEWIARIHQKWGKQKP